MVTQMKIRNYPGPYAYFSSTISTNLKEIVSP